jgi:hypothetical protein
MTVNVIYEYYFLWGLSFRRPGTTRYICTIELYVTGQSMFSGVITSYGAKSLNRLLSSEVFRLLVS